MAVHLITGLPGSSKTLNTLRMVDEQCKGRSVYFYGIKQCVMPGWTELTLDELHDWMSLPSGSVIVVDEAQDVWPPIPSTRAAPESIQELAKHRHQGKDFYVITQSPTFIDSRVRKIAGPHYHYERAFGRSGAKEIRFESVQNDPANKSARALAEITGRSFDKRYFDKYLSAEVHTYKPKIPKVVWVVCASIVVVIAMGATIMQSWGVFGGQSDKEKIVVGERQSIQDVTKQVAANGYTDSSIMPGEKQPLTVAQYAAQFRPRIENVPHSAPAYDKITEVKSYPRPQCIYRHRTGKCKCYTQQATPLDITTEACMNMVQNGWFNPYIEDKASPESQPHSDAPAAVSGAIPGTQFRKIRIHDSTSYPSRDPT